MAKEVSHTPKKKKNEACCAVSLSLFPEFAGRAQHSTLFVVTHTPRRMPVTALGANGGAVNAPARPAARARAALRRPVVALPAPALRRPAALPPPSAAGLAGDGGAGAAPFPRSSSSAPEAGTSGRPPSPPRASATAERRDVETMGSSSRSPGGLGAPATTLADRPPDPPTFMTATGRIIASECEGRERVEGGGGGMESSFALALFFFSLGGRGAPFSFLVGGFAQRFGARGRVGTAGHAPTHPPRRPHMAPQLASGRGSGRR